jgi:hypothetical protein
MKFLVLIMLLVSCGSVERNECIEKEQELAIQILKNSRR